MTILEMLNNKINDLKINSQEELNRTINILNTINNSIDALNDEKKLKDYDFSIAINLVNSNSFGIIDLEKIIKSVKNVLIAKYDYKQTFLIVSEEGKQAIKSFKERLNYLKEELEKRIEEQSKIEVDEKILENLEDLKRLLEGKGRRKYYTYEMIESLFEVFDYNDFTYQDIEELINELAVSKNIKGKLVVEEKKDFNEVKALFQEFLGENTKFDLLDDYKDEICARIDLDNARNIFEFFKDNNILDKFSNTSILQIVIYGQYDYIKDLYYQKVLPRDNLKNLYYADGMSCVWINQKSTDRRHSTSIKIGVEKESKHMLLSSISEACDDDVWENIRLLKENENLLSDKYNLSNIDFLWVVTKPTWLIKKNIELFKTFNFTNVKLTALVQNDLEDKIHFITELGLLNTPRTPVFKEIEKTVPKYNEFMLNGQRKKHTNDSILNYYHRNTSEIGKVSYAEYIYWFYKMLMSGKEEFYQNFFSSYRAGTRNKSDFYDSNDLNIIKNRKLLERLIDDNFVTYYYDALIPNYDFYDRTIREYSSSQGGDVIIPYFDNSILSDEKLSRLEEHIVSNEYLVEGEYQISNNPYVYLFGTNIISRYKVLRNLSILKNKYGYLNDDMILTCVVRGSYIDKDTFEMIKESIRNEVLVK